MLQISDSTLFIEELSVDFRAQPGPSGEATRSDARRDNTGIYTAGIENIGRRN